MRFQNATKIDVKNIAISKVAKWVTFFSSNRTSTKCDEEQKKFAQKNVSERCFRVCNNESGVSPAIVCLASNAFLPKQFRKVSVAKNISSLDT